MNLSILGLFLLSFFFYLFGSGGSQKPFKLTFDKLFLYIALCYSQQSTSERGIDKAKNKDGERLFFLK